MNILVNSYTACEPRAGVLINNSLKIMVRSIQR